MSKEKMYAEESVEKIYKFTKETAFRYGKEAGYREFVEQSMLELGEKLGVDLIELNILIEMSRNKNHSKNSSSSSKRNWIFYKR